VKFNSDLDAQLFAIELGISESLDSYNKEYEPTNEQMGLFLKKRSKLESTIKSHRKSQIQKGNWRKNRAGMMRGIKAFHKSVEGKRFHRNLGNFLATRLLGNDYGRPNNPSVSESIESLKALNSAKTHLYIELEYYHQVHEQVELDEFTYNYAHTLFRDIENKIIKQRNLTENEIQFLFDITENAAVIKSFADKSGKSVKDVENMWNGIKSSIEKSGKKESDDGFYKLLVGTLKKQLNLT
jgi:hypothetical protein